MSREASVEGMCWYIMPDAFDDWLVSVSKGSFEEVLK